MSRETDLWAVARAVHAFLEPVWPEWHRAWGGQQPVMPSQWTCGRSSLFLQKVLNEDLAIPAQWVSGVPQEGSEMKSIGFFTGSRWEGHAWVEVQQGWIIDITADQFGADAIIVTRDGDARYCKGESDTALPVFVANRQRAVAELWPHWQASPLRTGLMAATGNRV